MVPRPIQFAMTRYPASAMPRKEWLELINPIRESEEPRDDVYPSLRVGIESDI